MKITTTNPVLTQALLNAMEHNSVFGVQFDPWEVNARTNGEAIAKKFSVVEVTQTPKGGTIATLRSIP